MTTFLELVAKDLYEELGGDFTKTTIIFPNKRASLFFNSYLADISDSPMWTPYYTSISDIFASLGTRTIGDPIRLVCTLYESFRKVTQTEETLDKFYSWGEMMLSDFEDIDNNMADAGKLFANIADLEQMTDFSFLSENQIEAIRQFFVNFNPEDHTRLKDKFLSIWNALYPTYKDFNDTLASQGICYEGMMKREIINELKENPERISGKLDSENYVIIGFNVLNETERRLFRFLKENRRTYFYWDYDEAYRNYEAGQFIKEDISLFGNRFDSHPEYYRNFRMHKNIRFIASPTENAQSRFVSQWINETIKTHEHLNENAIVLCNESVLPSVLHSIPPILGNEDPMALNVTMGYPLSNTPVYSFVQALLELQTHGKTDSGSWRYTQVANVLRHPFTRRLTGNYSVMVLSRLKRYNILFPADKDLVYSPTDGMLLTEAGEENNSFLRMLFTQQRSLLGITSYISEVLKCVGASYRGVKEEILQKESIFNAYTIINRIHTLQEEEASFNINSDTLSRLIRQILGSKAIPFHGEPAIGLQVMGVLETRNLDFRNVILLSCNESMLPKNVHRASLIPYNLRAAHGMTTIEKQTSLYAYYFYNLLQRAENITILYNSSTEGLNKGEMSRFMMQMKIESDKILGPDTVIESFSLTSDSESQDKECGIVSKTSEVMERMTERFATHPLSPSAINNYITCPLKFYFQHVACFTQNDDIAEEVDNPTFGNIFHYCMEKIYSSFIDRQVQSHNLEELAKDSQKIKDLVDEGFAIEFFNKPKGQVKYVNRYNGQQLLNHYVLCKYVKNQLLYDAKACPIKVIGVEDWIEHYVDIDGRKIKLGGKIDRYETLSNSDGSDYIRIVDYKTGSHFETGGKAEDLFNGKSHYVFQAFYYSYVLLKSRKPVIPIKPSLMFAAQKDKDDTLYLDKIKVDDFSKHLEYFEEGLFDIIRKIFDPGIPFTQCSDANNCKYCPFNSFCKR